MVYRIIDGMEERLVTEVPSRNIRFTRGLIEKM